MDIESLLEAVGQLPPRAAIARETARLRRDELDGALAAAGTALRRDEVDALVDRGVCLGGHRFEQYLAVQDLARASSWIAEQRSLARADPRPLLTVGDVRGLHGIATAGQPALLPAAWRLAVVPGTGGIVSAPPWTIAKEVDLLVDRFRLRPPPRDLAAALAAFLGRFMRIRPFTGANGRTAHLAASLVLRRLDAVPLALRRDQSAAYRAAVVAAENGAPAALAALIEDSLVQGCRRLLAAAEQEPLVPLRTLAGGRYAALIKAAKRGRLAVVVRDGRVYSTQAWLDAYAAGTRRSAGV